MGRTPGSLVYGTILVSTLLAAESAKHETYARTVVAVVIALALYWLAIAYAEDVGRRSEAGEHFSLPVFARGAAHELPVIAGALAPLGVVLGCWAAGVSLETAVVAAVWAAAAIIAATELALGLRSHLEGADLVIQTAFGVLFGLGVVALRVLLH